MALPQFVKLVEVGPRDGLQNESFEIPIDVRVDLINKLSDTGLSVIEAGSFVYPSWVPQMAGTDTVLKGINRKARVSYPVLVPNMVGYKQAKAAGAQEIAIFIGATETFNQKNLNASIKESLHKYQEVCQQARQDNMFIRGYISCVLGCPFEKIVTPAQVVPIAQILFQMGCDEVSLGDTLGVGTVKGTKNLINALKEVCEVEKLAVHFHDTYGQALVNIYAAMEEGIHIIDSSILGLGGCPYAEGASGNVATEDVVYMLDGMDIETGVDLTKLIEVGRYICDRIDLRPASKAAYALNA